MKKKYIIFITLFIILIDVISKRIIINNFSLNESMTIINNFIYLTYAQNTGAAFSIFTNNTLFIIVITSIIILYIMYYLYKNKLNKKIELVAYSLVLGGAIGNLIDRIFYRFVIDFIDVYIFSYDFPIFNLADICITIGIILLLVEGLGVKNDNKR